MVTSHSSYLQTLDKNEANAFVASLQKIKEHLGTELAWMNTQLQQKTAQLQGIETILSEATELGLTADLAPKAKSASKAKVTEPTPADISPLPSSDLLTSASTNGNGDTPVAPIAETALPEVTLPTVAITPEPTPATKRGGSRKNSGTKTKQAVKASKPGKTSTSRAKQPAKSAKSAKPAKPAKPAKSATPVKGSARDADLQQYLQAEFRDKSLTDSVAQILDDAKEALSVSDVMTELYDGLSGDRYKRAKNSITNVLSVGRSKGKWKSTGRGMYANNSVATA